MPEQDDRAACRMVAKAKPNDNGAENEPSLPLLTRDLILGAHDRKIDSLPVPEWGGQVFLRVMIGRERDLLEERLTAIQAGKRSLENFRAWFAAQIVVDENGKRQFVTEEHINLLGEKSGAALERIFVRGLKLNRIREEDVQELVENFPGGRSDDSGSTSPAS